MTAHVRVLGERLNRLTGIVGRAVTAFEQSGADTNRRIEAVEASLKSLGEVQMVTELKAQSFIDNLNQGRNGHA